MKEKGKSIMRRALIRVLCCALAAVVLGVAVHTAYGHIFKTHAIETAQALTRGAVFLKIDKYC